MKALFCALVLLMLCACVPAVTAEENYLSVAKWGTGGSGDGQFSSPKDIAVDSAGNIYVVDKGNYRVQKFTSNGAFVTKWGTRGTGDGQFEVPAGIAVDASGYVYVVDNENDRVQKFTSNGAYVTKYGKNGGDGSSGSGNGEFYQPYGIAIDGAGNMYIADAGNHRVQKLTSTGTFVTKWGKNGGDGFIGSGDGSSVIRRQ